MDEIITAREAMKFLKMNREMFFQKLKTDPALAKICRRYGERALRFMRSDLVEYYKNQRTY